MMEIKNVVRQVELIGEVLTDTEVVLNEDIKSFTVKEIVTSENVETFYIKLISNSGEMVEAKFFYEYSSKPIIVKVDNVVIFNDVIDVINKNLNSKISQIINNLLSEDIELVLLGSSLMLVEEDLETTIKNSFIEGELYKEMTFQKYIEDVLLKTTAKYFKRHNTFNCYNPVHKTKIRNMLIY